MITRVTYALVFLALGAMAMLVTIITRPPKPQPEITVAKREYVSAAFSPKWACTKEEFTEYRRACAARARMEIVKPKE